MIVSLVARFQGLEATEANRFAAWARALRRLRDDWQAGERPAPAALRARVNEVPEVQREEALLDLIAEHLRLSWRDGATLFLEDYCRELAGDCALAEPLKTMPADLIEAEFLARHQQPCGDFPSPAMYAERFPHRRDVLARLQARCLDGGRFVKLRLRGLGALGRVWEASDRHRREIIALKELRPDVPHRAAALETFRREAKLLRKLDHPCVVHVEWRDPGDGQEPFQVMPLLDGPTLGGRIREWHLPPADRTAEERRALWRELLECFSTVCEAMAHAHKHGVIHRDLKPGNIVLDRSGEPLILDWGMAAALEDTAPPDAAGDALVGTPEYMPPEQVDGHSDTRSDVFGLGAILYEILAARPPHPWAEGARPANWRQIVRECRIPRPGQLNARAPRALEAVCMKALARQPADRQPSAAVLADEVRRWLAGTISTSFASLWGRGWKRAGQTT